MNKGGNELPRVADPVVNRWMCNGFCNKGELPVLASLKSTLDDGDGWFVWRLVAVLRRTTDISGEEMMNGGPTQWFCLYVFPIKPFFFFYFVSIPFSSSFFPADL